MIERLEAVEIEEMGIHRGDAEARRFARRKPTENVFSAFTSASSRLRGEFHLSTFLFSL